MKDKDLGVRVARLRRAAGLSQAELAGPKLSPSYISLLEAGKRTPSGDVVQYLADRLGCEVTDLLGAEARAGAGEIDLELKYAEMTALNGRPEAALADYERIQATIDRDEQPALWLAAETGIAQSLERVGRLEEAVVRYEVLRTASERSRDFVAGLPVTVALCRCYRELGDLSHAVTIAEDAVAEVERLNLAPTRPGIELLSTLVGLHCERGDLHRASYLAARAIEKADQVSDRKALGAVLWNASVAMHRNGRTADAVELIERALAIYSEGDDIRALARLRNAYAAVLLEFDEPDITLAEGLLRQSANALSDVGSDVDRAYCETAMARVKLRSGDPEAAVRHAEGALGLLGPLHRLQSARTLLVLAAARLSQGDHAAAREAYERSALMLEASAAGRQAAAAWAELAEIMEATGQPERAIWAYRQGMRCLGQQGRILPAGSLLPRA
ncbi:helix-turn-helix domain-containing protein [Kitasatospora sp. NPDC096077]|uniref:helix-turn-helix domain-containing protein n=1 Tax=Kitasatospora sp. NPDC096077 TaxID=3155544 RepID=UPI00332CB2D8